jgi:hypothetical protein
MVLMPVLTLRHRLSSGLTAPAEARRVIASLSSVTSPEVIERARLVASEIVTYSVTNSTSASGSSIALRVIITRSHLRLEVEDEQGGLSVPDHVEIPSFEAETGRELWMVEQVSDAWGTLPGGIWAELNWVQPATKDLPHGHAVGF